MTMRNKATSGIPVTAGNPESELRLGISACLLGEQVRYDGGHKRDDFIVGTLGRFVQFVPVCPEVELGLATPRETIQLLRRDGTVRLVGTKSDADHTVAMKRFARRRIAEFAKLGLAGFIVKKNSPSCGMLRVKVHGPGSSAQKSGRGLFTAALMETMPLLPVEEEERLHDLRLRENFVERIFAYRRLRDLFGVRWKRGDLVRFHIAEKLLLLAHQPAAYTELGQLVAHVKDHPRKELAATYQQKFMDALARQASTGRHVNALKHMAGYLKKQLSEAEKQEVQATIEDFRYGLIPLIVPLTLLRHYVRIHEIAYLLGQAYIDPHPKELMLRNHV